MLNFMTARAVIANGLFILACLPGCVAFSDSSAMRIEVEVYKGPLSLEPETQLGELYGYLVEAHNGLGKTHELIAEIRLTYKCPQVPDNGKPYSINCSILDAIEEDALSYQKKLTIPICILNPSAQAVGTATCDENSVLSQIDAKDDNRTNWKEFGKDQRRFNEKLSGQKLNLFKEKPEEKLEGSYTRYRQALIEAGRIAAVMQAGAFRYATASSAGQSYSWDVRVGLTYLIMASSEYGNQIQARAEALLKQLGKYGRDRRELPLSTHLRETEPTDFVHLFDWMDGHTPWIYDYVTLNFSPNIEERIKIVERLYADHFWSKINTVYASGRGKTQMAFIKDETGNWNLKSFDNDPTELLEAYTNVAKKALQKAAELAAGAATGGSSSAGLVLAKQLRDFAAETEPDKAISQPSPAGSLSLDHLRTRLADKLDPTHFNADFAKEAELLGAVDRKEKDVKAAAAKPDTTDSQKLAADNALVSARKDLLQHRHQIVARWEAIVNDHSNLVDILSSTVKKK